MENLTMRGMKPAIFMSWASRRVWRLFLFIALLVSFTPVQAAAPVREVVVVFKTHFDIGYTDMASNVVQRYRTTMIDEALKVVDQNRGLPPEQQFAWTLPGWPLAKIMADWPGQTPGRLERVQAAFKQGRFVVHALPFTTHTELLDIEDLVRGMGYSSRLSREAGLSLPRDAKMTDVPCHAWIMPTMLRHAGVDFLHLGCNAASSSPKVPRLFLWEGPDGSRLLTMYTAESYGTGLIAPKDWPYQTWLALIHTGDNHGPPTPDEVKKLLAEAAQKLPGVKVRIGRLSDFADAILAEKADIPVVRGDMPDTWIHGPMSDPGGAALARNTRPAIAITESLHTLLNAWGVPQPEISADLARAREQSLLYGEHTWGGAQYWVTKYGSGTKWGYGETWRADHEAKRFQRLEDSWAEHTAYIEKARDIVQLLLQSQLKALAQAVNQEGERIVVYNPLPWARKGNAAVNVEGTKLSTFKSSSLRYAGDSSFGPNFFGCDGKTLRFDLQQGPPMGYATLVFNGPANGNKEEPTVGKRDGQEFLRFDGMEVHPDCQHGTVRFSQPMGRPAADETGIGQVIYERFDSNQVASYVKSYVKISADWAVNELGKPAMPPAAAVPYRAASPTNFTVRYEASLHAGEVIMDAPASPSVPFGVTTRFTFYTENLPYYDIEVTLHKKPADPWPEAAWLCLPFKLDQPQFRVGRQGSIMDPAKDIVLGANPNLYAVDTGVAIFDPSGKGVSVIPLDSPLVSLGEPGGWKYNPGYVPTKAAVYVNLFNNQWTTNFRMWNEGTWKSRVRISRWLSNKLDLEKDLIRPGLEARYPLQAVCVTGPAGKLATSDHGLLVTRDPVSDYREEDAKPAMWRKGVLTTCFGPNPDGSGTLLRLWEYAGARGPCYVNLPVGLKAKTAQPVDLRGQPTGAAIPVKNGAFSFDLKPFAPASFVFSE
jgi:hypothetical protein